jgi:hypothetical protein
MSLRRSRTDEGVALDMKVKPIYPAALAILLLIGVALAYVFFIMLAGFPDRFMSAQEAASVQLLIAFNWFSIATAFCFLLLAFFARKRDIARPFLYACAAFVAAVIVALTLETYFITHFMDSAGG